MASDASHIAVIGGTGNLGYALARRWAKAGLNVLIGSRSTENAQAAAAKLTADVGITVEGANNVEVAGRADVIVVAVPFAAQSATLADIRDEVQGKLVIDTTVPLVPPKVMRVSLPEEGSAAVRAAGILGEGVTLTSAFHNVAAHKLVEDGPVDCDVLVFGDSKEARNRVIPLVEATGLRGLHGGALINSAAAEALTSVLILMNKTYACDGAGLRITGKLQMD